MKKKFFQLLSLLVVLLGVSFTASAQIYVRVRPVAPVIVRPPQPSRLHIWIGNDWEPSGPSYRYTGGHWDAPPHQGERYYHGRWKRHGHDGHEWKRGGWKKK